MEYRIREWTCGGNMPSYWTVEEKHTWWFFSWWEYFKVSSGSHGDISYVIAHYESEEVATQAAEDDAKAQTKRAVKLKSYTVEFE